MSMPKHCRQAVQSVYPLKRHRYRKRSSCTAPACTRNNKREAQRNVAEQCLVSSGLRWDALHRWHGVTFRTRIDHGSVDFGHVPLRRQSQSVGRCDDYTAHCKNVGANTHGPGGLCAPRTGVIHSAEACTHNMEAAAVQLCAFQVSVRVPPPRLPVPHAIRH